MSGSRKFLITTLAYLGVVLSLLPIFNVGCADKDDIIKNATNPVVSFVIENNPNEASALKKISDSVNTQLQNTDLIGDKEKFLVYDKEGKQHSIYVNMQLYNKLNTRTKQNVMQITLQTINNSKISRTNKNKLYNYIANCDSTTSSLVRQLSDDVTADYASAYGYFRPFSGVLGTFLGLITIVIFALLAVTIVLDLAYLVLPGFQYFIDVKNDGNKIKGIGKIVSVEAIQAVRQSESNNRGDYLSIYLKTKTKQLVVLGICILYLASGKIYVLLGSIIDYFQVFLDL